MTTSPPPSTPTVAIARVLRRLGLAQGRGGDFRVTGEYARGERRSTFVVGLTRRADEVIADHADDIEQWTSESGWPFRVSVRFVDDRPRPFTHVSNGHGERVRDTPPEPEQPAPAPEPAPEPEPELPPAGTVTARFFEGARERAWQSRQVHGLRWSRGQAELMAAAGSVQLLFDRDGVLRHYPRPGWAGQPVADGRIDPLVKAGFLTITEPYGPGSKRVSTTADGRDALLLWRRWRPTPVVKDRKEDREPLRPLLGGEEARRRADAAAEDKRRRDAEREALFVAIEETHAWEARDDRLWAVWAKVQGITYRLGRKRPAGWVPTDEEIEKHHIDRALVEELRADAECPQPRPALPRTEPLRARELPPLPAAPLEEEQLSLFGVASS